MGTIKSLYHPVRKVPSAELMPGMEFNNQNNHAIVVDLPTGPKVVNFCSAGYTLVSNEQLIKPILASVKKHYEVDVNVTSYRDSSFYIDLVFKGHEHNMLKKDDIIPKLRIVNSYDGSVKYSYEQGFYRVVCSNGMTVPESEHTKIKSMHTASIEKKSETEFLMDHISGFLENTKDTILPYKELQSKKVLMDDLPELVDEISQKTKFPKKQAEEAMGRIQQEMKEHQLPLTNWLVYNGFNYQLNHNDAINTKPHKKTAIDKDIMNYLLNS